jgi:hypothetical protein
MYEFAAHMKTLIRYSLIIFTLGIFGSCAEPFREMGTRRSDFYLNHSTQTGHGAYAINTTTKAKSASAFHNLHRDTLNVAEERLLHMFQNIGAADSVFIQTGKKGDLGLMSERTLEIAISQKTLAVQKKGATRLAPSFIKQPHVDLWSLKRSTNLTQKSDTFIGKSNSSKKEPINGYLIALGILGLILSLLGMFNTVIGILLDIDSLLMEILGFWSSYPIIIDFLLFLLGFIGSIGLLINPRFEDSNPRKIAMIILASLPMILWLLFILFLS